MYLDVSISIYICRYINICEAIKIEKKKERKDTHAWLKEQMERQGGRTKEQLNEILNNS